MRDLDFVPESGVKYSNVFALYNLGERPTLTRNMSVRIIRATNTARLVSTATSSAKSHDDAPEKYTTSITSVMVALAREMIRSPLQTGSNQNERTLTPTPLLDLSLILVTLVVVVGPLFAPRVVA